MTEYAEILRALADGNQVQWQQAGTGYWKYGSMREIMQCMMNGISIERLRIRPATITINGIEVPEPMRVAPSCGTKIFIVLISSDQFCLGVIYEKDVGALDIWLKRGVCHLTQEAAEQHARALILASGGSLT